jgi:hypothetical protein
MRQATHGLETMKTMNFFITCALPLVTLVMMAPQAIAADVKYALECGATKCVPSCDDDPDPVYRTRVARAVTGEIVVVHYAASGETYVRNDQYRDLRFWTDGKADNWSGVSIKRPDWTMVGRLQIDKRIAGSNTLRNSIRAANYRALQLACADS